MKYRIEINFLRFISITGVLFYHANFNFLRGGFLGVDLFFVISGFLISYKIFDDLENKKFTFLKFYIARVRRILPALYFSMIASVLIVLFFYFPKDVQDFKDSIFYTLFFVSNIYFWNNINYFSPEIDTRILAHTWSLAIEEQFYFFIPLIIYLFYKFNISYKKILIITFFMSFVSVFMTFTDYFFIPVTKFYLLPTRAWELSIGIICSLLLKIFNFKSNKTLTYFSLILIILSFIIFNKYQVHPGYLTLMPTIGAAIFILFYDNKIKISSLIENKYFEKIGLASYSIYLFHFPIFAVDRYIKLINYYRISQILVDLFLLFLSILVGFASWKFIETPTRNYKKFKNKKLLVLCISLFGILLIFSKTDFLDNLVEQQFNEYTIFYEGTNRRFVDTCLITENVLIDTEKCSESYQENKENFLIIGDSLSNNLFFALENTLSSNQTLSLFSVTGCPPLITDFPKHEMNFNEEKCIKNYLEIKNEIQKKKFDKIFIAYDYSQFEVFENQLGFFDDSLELFNDSLSLINDSKIILFGQPVKWKSSLINILQIDIKFNRNLEPYSSRFLETSIFNYDKKIKEFTSNNNYEYISLIDIFCDDIQCKRFDISNKEIFLFWNDQIHLTQYGIAMVQNYLTKYINK